jgi:hypothetical protein
MCKQDNLFYSVLIQNFEIFSVITFKPCYQSRINTVNSLVKPVNISALLNHFKLVESCYWKGGVGEGGINIMPYQKQI